MKGRGTNPKDRLGTLKPMLHLVPPVLTLETSEVFRHSSVKYGPLNWRSKKVRLTVYLDAIERHLLALKDGEMLDPDDHRPHAAHLAANCAILLDAAATGNLIDDRKWPNGTASKLIAQLTIKTKRRK